MALTDAERDAIERLGRVARGEVGHEYYDDRPEDDPADFEPPAPLTGVWAAERDRLLKLAQGKK